MAAMMLARDAPLKALRSGAHFVKQSSQGENVGADVGVLSFQLLRGHVSKGAEDDPFFCQRFR